MRCVLHVKSITSSAAKCHQVFIVISVPYANYKDSMIFQMENCETIIQRKKWIDYTNVEWKYKSSKHANWSDNHISYNIQNIL